ncbi:MAG: LysM peptidoglycan-binding domain-containing protein [Candidatus Levybacteria bacterium]|nr:LysM peptidoglycan-binding domain-containing protein [Candidatus Levybacteria bacterium]
MPKKKSVKKNNFFSQFKLDESYISLIIGVVVIILIAGGVIFLLRSNRESDTSSLQYKPTIEVEEGSEIPGNLPTSYQIKEGDSLWTISEKFYKSGYNWVDIVKANNLSDPSTIHVGNKLTIPNVQQKSVTVVGGEEKPAAVPNQITGATYKVKKGDYLWDIAVRAYGDGYQWVKIANANNLTDPNLIFSDNVLKIPR